MEKENKDGDDIIPTEGAQVPGDRDLGAHGSNKGTKGEGGEGEGISGEEGLPTPFPPPPP